ncbi:proline dehydrogenase family protein [Janthinobacterium agaricidamnosum]|uniref:proline dehydrogenase n=1 Tax=Janthinobacterium agaricidamnosum NBRC 102515 = DSM 9628 TaxID=1349767 RepID=W0UX12_9BURK|nr:proline dehydrogenase family protein [Janthinobacterium agaricidamnosum]CDG81024.1 proline dehydrogenase family protein [Janthinobacterium agaricidamnosum NBRC 102515 = DSM 9628]
MQFFNTLLARAIPWLPRAAIHAISRRYIAGDTLADALARVRRLNAEGFRVTLDVLGETVSALRQADATAMEYIDMLEAIAADGLQATVSIKPSALGLLLDTAHCERLVRRILASAQAHGNCVCIDMEDVRCTQLEIDLFLRLQRDHDNVSLALQAYLQRTYQDIEILASTGSSLRICKGIYVEERRHLVDLAWHDRRAINAHYLNHVARCFDAGSFVAIATHDAALAGQVIALARSKGIDRTRFEFQLLLGVCEPLRDRLRDLGYSVCIYVPFGADWYGYSTRRLKENPAIAGHVARALIGFRDRQE